LPCGAGAENSVRTCDLQILGYEAAEAISSERPNGRCGVRGSAACWGVLMERSVWTVRVVMIDVLAQHRREAAESGDQQVAEAFAAQGADPAFGERVCSWCTYRGADGVDVRAGEGRVERGGELASPSRIKTGTG
jgi:hypothetical protein